MTKGYVSKATVQPVMGIDSAVIRHVADVERKDRQALRDYHGPKRTIKIHGNRGFVEYFKGFFLGGK